MVRPVIFALAGGEGHDGNNTVIVCKQSATVNVKLTVCNWFSLMLRNRKWVITRQDMAEPLLARPTLQVLGLNTQKFSQQPLVTYAIYERMRTIGTAE